MLELTRSLKAWGTPEFETVLKEEIEQLDPALLPLQQGLTTTSHVVECPFKAMILKAPEEAGVIRATVGIFYSGIIAGCSCADDPTPVEEQNEYCELLFTIAGTTGETTVSLVSELQQAR